MKVRIAVVLVVGTAAITGSHLALHAQQPTTKSVLDGVYTEEQAKRGGALYAQHCTSCHGQSLMGEDMTPPLTGSQFSSNWNDTTVGELSERIRVTMPADGPGKLSRQQSADILAYILSYNKYPAGQTELPKETEILKQIRIEPPK
jgi:mono/diheme cytochrome c family protein